ncbi:MAG: citrate/2-methylcitrate synthase [Akkermansiaceae bacterium]|nr:citrate/2-methylcitrate synthase [Akkermansiaceae bacterium]
MAARRRRFEELRNLRGEGPDLLDRYHADTEGGASAFTVRMHRPDAQTMNRSRVMVDRAGVKWIYREERSDLRGEPRVYEVELP